jgi:integrase
LSLSGNWTVTCSPAATPRTAASGSASYTDVAAALDAWRDAREAIPELVKDPYLFSQLGRQRRDGTFPDAGGELSTTAVIKIVRPIMLAAGVAPGQAHPHTLRHSYGRLYIAARGAELSRLQRLMGHATKCALHVSPDTGERDCASPVLITGV